MDPHTSSGGRGDNAVGRSSSVQYVKKVPKFLQQYYDEQSGSSSQTGEEEGGSHCYKVNDEVDDDDDDVWREIDAAQIVRMDGVSVAELKLLREAKTDVRNHLSNPSETKDIKQVEAEGGKMVFRKLSQKSSVGFKSKGRRGYAENHFHPSGEIRDEVFDEMQHSVRGVPPSNKAVSDCDILCRDDQRWHHKRRPVSEKDVIDHSGVIMEITKGKKARTESGNGRQKSLTSEKSGRHIPTGRQQATARSCLSFELDEQLE